MNKVLKTLKELDIEDFIWMTYLFVACFAIISNSFERDYTINKSKKSFFTYKSINITLLTISFFIYLYFMLLAYSRYKEIDQNTTVKQVIITNASFIATALFIIGAIILLLIEIFGTDLDIDVLA